MLGDIKKHLIIERFMNRVFIILLLFFSIVSCNKAVSDYNEDYVGFWKSEISIDVLTGTESQSHFIINEDKNECGISCVPNCFQCDCSSFSEGRAQINVDRTKIRIGQSRNTITLTINNEPYLNSDSVWVCKLNGLEYYKQ
jgi:hypothetical protein